MSTPGRMELAKKGHVWRWRGASVKVTTMGEGTGAGPDDDSGGGSTLTRLAHLAESLGASRSTLQVAAAVARHAAPVLDARYAVVATIEPDGETLRLHSNEAFDPEVARGFEMIPLRTHVPITLAFTRNESVLIPDHQSLVREFPDLAVTLDPVGIEALACVPLQISGGGTFGVFAIGWTHTRVLDPQSRALLDTIADLCAQSIARAGVTDEIARRAAKLADLAQRLAGARSTDQVARLVAREVVTLVGATAASVGLIDRNAGVLRVHHGPDVAPEMAALYANPPIDTPLLFTDVARTGTARFIGTYDEYRERYPDTAPANAQLGTGARAAVPLHDRNGVPFGAVVFSWDRSVDFGGTIGSVLATVGELVGQTLERSRLADAEHQLVGTFRHRLLSPIPSIPGLAVGGAYRAASEEIGIGGDWYEGIALDGGRLGLVVGDVAGHGIEAVADMAHLRSVLAAFLQIGLPLHEVVDRATEAIGQASTVTASAFIAIADPAQHRLQYLLIGHPPPILLVDGEVSLVCEPLQPLLGTPTGQSAIAGLGVGSIAFPVGATLIVYTDGLVERRGESIQRGLDHLALLAARASSHLDVDVIVRELLSGCLGEAPPEDDVAIVVVRAR